MSTNEQLDAAAVGIETMTAWLDRDDDIEFTMEVVLSRLQSDDPSEIGTLIAGLINVSGRLLIRLERLGHEPRAVLREMAMNNERARKPEA